MHVRNIKELKKNLRAKFRQIRERMQAEQKSLLDSEIQSRLLSLKEYAKTDVIFTYVSKAIEVDTWGLIHAALSNRKKVAVPRCVAGTRMMEFYYIHGSEDLELGAFGVLEPDPLRCQKVESGTEGLCVVPGLAFDAQGYRLGYGKGYYDRFLSSFPGKTVGICYMNCVQWNLPHGYYDRPVDVLITEKYIRRISRQEKQEDIQ